MIDAVDCQGLGGGMTLGFVQAGAHLVQKVEQAGAFGVAQCEDNRHLLGHDWEAYDGAAETWPVHDVPLVFGNPPCSGFSMMSVRAGSAERRDYRGPEAAINSCMWDLVEYAAKCDAEVVVMESVPTAGKDSAKGGRPLMQRLRQFINELTGHDYKLYHCFHNGAALGASSVRRRYFMVLSRIPFGVSIPEIDKVVHMREVLEDIAYEDTSIAQPFRSYLTGPNFWTKMKREGSVVSGNFTFFDVYESAHGRRLADAIALDDWREGEQLVDVMKRYFEETGGEFPPGEAWSHKQAQDAIYHRPLEKQKDYDAVLAGMLSEEEYCKIWKTASFPPSRPVPWQGGAYQPRRWRSDRAGLVMAGNGLTDIVHPWLNRTFTYREAARIMGFPDNWSVDSYTENRGGAAVFGKGVLVESGEWIGDCAIKAIEGEPHDHIGEEINPGEFLIDISNIHRDIYNERTGQRTPR